MAEQRQMRGRRSLEPEHNINLRIVAPELRLIGDNIETPGVYSRKEAQALADEMGLDLIEINGKAVPPVCRVQDYKKFLYDEKKRKKEQESKQMNVVVKEIRFGPNTDDHDFQFKLKHAKSFLDEGNKVRAYVHFKGRAIQHKHLGEGLLTRFIQELMEHGLPEQMPKLDGKRMFVMITPKKKK